ncbi:hypothetical protein COX95_04845 [bacterium CG_4_10_14_0_2_um_filter_33_32]|nr:MAG: hypothetical protein AUJ93_02930 [bacterium CG2_30_33_46]PIR67941.1 MAG: hypothetical protein COU50_00640 [bacterium CG10_big_fil_rev_8_21_14_0_10_33_18]PIU76512.1 MAG: hypothetical protein COS74_03655 [bacterium CG06_land_8_20_14_3_00_33_50]PIW81573.1 MAG: hypothetical protein COZ97_01080 [bacterium CG_4_8_14_3_um_filter_33_28]PIY85119.1 MAG: hypothetical protein COY76_03840 [bacterium CG_4_10_14_0_8_um_filter_33_57]PIZ85212.1 MAG: hypothetical protein COX95_04845 [bacterium CG_4_10_1
MNKLKKILNDLENKNITASQWIITILVVILFRTIGEDFYSSKKIIDYFEYFFHYPIYYISIALFIILIISFFAKEKPIKVGKVLIHFWPIVIIPPIFDLIISASKAYDYSYIFNNFNFYFKNLFNFPVFLEGITYGIRLELLLATVSVAAYVYIKKQKILSSVLAASLFYVGIFGFIAFPYLAYHITIIPNFPLKDIYFLHNPIGSAGMSQSLTYYSAFNVVAILFLLILAIKQNHKKTFSLIANSSKKSFHYLLMFGFGLYLAYKIKTNLFLFDINILTQFLNAFFAVVLAWVSATTLNDVYDIESDKVSDDRKLLPKGIFSREEFIKISIISFVLSLLNAFAISYQFLIYILLYHAISFIYSSPPLRLKKIPIVSTFVVASLAISMMWAGYAFSSATRFNPITEFPVAITFTFVILFTLGFSFKDLKDLEGDKKQGVFTIPMFFKGREKEATSLLIVLCYMIVPFIFKNAFLAIPSIIASFFTHAFINAKVFRENRVYFTFFAYFICLVVMDYYLNFLR